MKNNKTVKKKNIKTLFDSLLSIEKLKDKEGNVSDGSVQHDAYIYIR